MACELIFIHIPKTGGSSIRTALAQIYGVNSGHHFVSHTPFGSDSYFIDPDSVMFKEHHVFRRVINKSLRDVDVPILYGHIPVWALEDVLPEVPRITVVRDPIEHILSTVFFWKNSNPQHPKSRIPARELAFDMMFWNTQSLYAGGVSLSNFSIVGITEKLNEFLAAVAERFSWPIKQWDIHEGRGPKAYRGERAELRADKEFCAALLRRNYRDVALYDLARSRWHGK